MTIKEFDFSTCKTCGLLYQPVDWLVWRVDGYCKKKCVPKPELVVVHAVQKVAQMTDITGQVWDVVVSINGLDEPLVGVHLADKETPINNSLNSFSVSTFVGIGGRSGYSFLRGLEFDEGIVKFSDEQWLPACQAVLAAIPGNLGQVRAEWVPNDGLPF